MTAGTGSSGMGIVLARQRASVTRHQVIWLASGHRVIWQGSAPPSHQHDMGLRVNWHDRGHWVRHWIVGPTAGIRSPGMTAGTGSSGTGSSGLTAGIESKLA
ncbi:unnamed protein product [Staurois parvus]|uniref:Uncharacterized protein n=1 Tax=Staurois parvus TaxID=386267 RepID=A0ABN9CEE4_9NEOB|nr:unnamed protein product [Staurois parvus]